MLRATPTRAAGSPGRPGSQCGPPPHIARSLLAGVRGDHQIAEDLAMEAERAVAPLRLGNILTVIQLARALSALSAARYAEAVGLLPRMFHRADPVSRQVETYAAIGYLAEAAVHAGRRDDARELMPLIEDLGRRTQVPLLHVGLHYARAVLAEDGCRHKSSR